MSVSGPVMAFPARSSVSSELVQVNRETEPVILQVFSTMVFKVWILSKKVATLLKSVLSL